MCAHMLRMEPRVYISVSTPSQGYTLPILNQILMLTVEIDLIPDTQRSEGICLEPELTARRFPCIASQQLFPPVTPRVLSPPTPCTTEGHSEQKAGDGMTSAAHYGEQHSGFCMKAHHCCSLVSHCCITRGFCYCLSVLLSIERHCSYPRFFLPGVVA